jgi:NifB/MoaA-like Fe-S oxidoreductase
VVTGRSMAPFIRERAPRLGRATAADVEVVEVVNDFFGETCTIAGLLGGRDVMRALGAGKEKDIVLVPAEALNADDLFIDSIPLAELEAAVRPARVLRGREITEALRTW